MALIKWIFLALLSIALVTVSMANRTLVTLQLLPAELASLIGVDLSIDLPLYAVIFAAVILGLAVGYLGEWLREHHLRKAGRKAQKEAGQLKREVRKLKRKSVESDDDVIALLDAKGSVR